MRLESFRVKGFGPFRSEFAVDLSALGEARLVAIVGPNGAGKSTALELALPGALYRSTPTRGALRDLATERAAFLESRVVNGQAWTIRHTCDVVSGKGESVVLDADGTPVLESSKVKEFDQWAARHLPSPEVLFSTVFAPQGASGFLGMKPGERKAVLLRVLGVERLEAMAERARERAREQRQALTVLEARIADERQRGGDVAELERELAAYREDAANRDAELERVRQELKDAQGQAEQARAAGEAYRAHLDNVARLDRELDAAKAALEDLEQRVANNRAVLADADKIRAAVAERDRLTGDLAQAEREELEVRSALRRLDDAIEGHDRTRREAHAAHLAAEDRAKRARARLGEREAIERAGAELEKLQADAEHADGEVKAREAELDELRGKRVAGAEERIEALRGGLQQIARLGGSEPLQRAVEVAGRALDLDHAQALLATQLPADIADVTKGLHAAQDRAAVARRKLSDAEATAARAADLEAAQAEADAAATEAREHSARYEQARADGTQAAESRAEQSRELSRASNRVTDLRNELGKVEPLARKAEPLARAEARLAELEPQMQAAREKRSSLALELSNLPTLAPPAPAPDLSAVEGGVRIAENISRLAHGAVAKAEQRLADARAATERTAELEAGRVAIETELADWNRLAEDFGRDGLQALEIDCAGPELSALCNDLLHTAFGPRWTVTIETQRLSADGKRQLEGCEVRVLDTVGGREAEASTFSGGERVILGEAVSLALSMLACRRAGVEGPTLVRDESGAALDPANARAYVAMLRRAADIVGARHVLFVSHSPEVQELADARIEVGRA